MARRRALGSLDPIGPRTVAHGARFVDHRDMSRLTALFFVLSLGLAFGLTACSSDSGGDKEGAGVWTTGKADGSFEIAEIGPLDFDSSTVVLVEGRVLALRVESYGGTQLTIDSRGLEGTDPMLVIEGPLSGDGDETAPGAAEVFAQDDDGGDGLDSQLTVTLDVPGVYRVIAGTYESLRLGNSPEGGSVEITASCDANCVRPSMTAGELIESLRASGQLDVLRGQLDGYLQTLIPDDTQRATAVAALDAYLASADASSTERFPVLPLQALGSLRSALGLIPGEPADPDAVVTGDLASALGACAVDRSYPSEVNPMLPGIASGHFPNRSLTSCQVAHAKSLAQVFTSLGANNGSSVDYGGTAHTSASSLVGALIESGHVVEVRNERTYANFIGLAAGGLDVVWPVWLDTGVEVGGEPLVIPMGHSHHAWRITGPDVNARVMFYLGISGAAYFAQTQTRPAWTGEFVSDGASSADGGADHILATFDAAASYLGRIQVESAGVAAGMPADGYGFVGVCNDSNAVIEYLTRGTITAFPLMRAASLDAEPELGDGLDAALRALPHDADSAPNTADVIERVLLMTPHEMGSAHFPDAALRDQIAAAGTPGS